MTCEPLPEQTVLVLNAPNGPVDLEYYPPYGQPVITVASGLVEGDCYKIRTLFGSLRLRYSGAELPGPRIPVVNVTPDMEYRCDPSRTF